MSEHLKAAIYNKSGFPELLTPKEAGRVWKKNLEEIKKDLQKNN